MAENIVGLAADAEVVELIRPKSFSYIAFHQFIRNGRSILGLSVLLVLVLAAVFAEEIAPYDPYKTNYSNVKQPPSAEHFIGTDELGRDSFSRLIYGARISLAIGFLVSSISTTIGVILGAAAGYFGGAIDMIIMRIVDVMMAFPLLVLAIALVAVFGPSQDNMMLALICLIWIWPARLVRGMILSLRETEFIVGAKAVGATEITIIFRHILPNVFPIVVVQASFLVAEAILAAAALSYLGLGAQPPKAEWGSMLSNAKELMRILPVMSIAPGVAIMVTVLANNFIGDALRDALDPTLRN
ncbi:MAG: ABC transporter permease [Chloroflexi bacterium]|nr:ABC transporter permease [Chloroflexota bacterium]